MLAGKLGEGFDRKHSRERYPKDGVGARVGMDVGGWGNPEWRGEGKANEPSRADGLGGKSQKVVGSGFGGSGDGGFWSGLDDAPYQLYHAEKE